MVAQKHPDGYVPLTIHELNGSAGGNKQNNGGRRRGAGSNNNGQKGYPRKSKRGRRDGSDYGARPNRDRAHETDDDLE